jgi:hypothetical protein
MLFIRYKHFVGLFAIVINSRFSHNIIIMFKVRFTLYRDVYFTRPCALKMCDTNIYISYGNVIKFWLHIFAVFLLDIKYFHKFQ